MHISLARIGTILLILIILQTLNIITIFPMSVDVVPILTFLSLIAVFLYGVCLFFWFGLFFLVVVVDWLLSTTTSDGFGFAVSFVVGCFVRLLFGCGSCFWLLSLWRERQQHISIIVIDYNVIVNSI